MLGFARRAGCVAMGTAATLDAVRHGRAALVILSEGASAASAKQVKSKCAFYGVTVLEVSLSPDLLAHTVGKDAPVVTLAVLDSHFASELLKSSGKEF